jgi:hypothetical protein
LHDVLCHARVEVASANGGVIVALRVCGIVGLRERWSNARREVAGGEGFGVEGVV